MRRVGAFATLLVAFVIVGVACPARCLAGAAPAASSAPPCHGHDDAPATDDTDCCDGLLAVLGERVAPEVDRSAAPVFLPIVLPAMPASWAVAPASRSVVRLGSPPTPLYRRLCTLRL